MAEKTDYNITNINELHLKTIQELEFVENKIKACRQFGNQYFEIVKEKFEIIKII
jgi:hypothetical protein